VTAAGLPALLGRAEQLRAARTPFVLATVVRAERPTSARPGDRALVLPDGVIEGFVGGACAESSVRLYGLQVLASGEPVMLRISPERGEAGRAGDAAGAAETTSTALTTSTAPMTATAGEAGRAGDAAGAALPAAGVITVVNPCLSGGTLEIFLEGVFPPPLVAVFGQGPIARALGEVGAALGYDMRALGPSGPVPPEASAVVVASHGRDEEAVLRAALDAGVPYVGLVASRRRGAQVLSGLGLPEDAAGRVHTPAGLDIGARTAAEVALSIFAEIVAERPRRGSAAPAGGTSEAPAGNGIAAGAEPAGLVTATDPVCGMTVAVTGATPRLAHDGGVVWFCGPGCRQAFAGEPGRYRK
jgi:xanthine dehydrogenase accessory factor